jgi:cytochrome c oxidase cbb3-type subunit III
VLSLSNSAHDSVRAVRGKDSLPPAAPATVPMASGNHALGAPDLTNRIWLYGGTVAAIADSITKGRTNVMPKHSNILTEARDPSGGGVRLVVVAGPAGK